jgi:hypothetical protein
MRKHFNKKIAPFIVSIGLIVYYTIGAILFITFIIPTIIKIITLMISIIITIIVINVLIERIKEIDGGEEDDLGKY